MWPCRERQGLACSADGHVHVRSRLGSHSNCGACFPRPGVGRVLPIRLNFFWSSSGACTGWGFGCEGAGPRAPPPSSSSFKSFSKWAFSFWWSLESLRRFLLPPCTFVACMRGLGLRNLHEACLLPAGSLLRLRGRLGFLRFLVPLLLLRFFPPTPQRTCQLTPAARGQPSLPGFLPGFFVLLCLLPLLARRLPVTDGRRFGFTVSSGQAPALPPGWLSA